MARKISLGLVSLVLAIVIVFLIGKAIADTYGPITGYWRATYCDIEGCPKGAQEVARNGYFSSAKQQDCFLLDHGIGRVYFLKEGSCELSQRPFEEEAGYLNLWLIAIFAVGLITKVIYGEIAQIKK